MGCCFSGQRGKNGVPKPSKWEPMEKRSCTDIVPLIVFVLFFIGMALIAAYSIASGSAERMIYGVDSYGNICNRKNKKIIENSPNSGMDLTGKPFVFYFGPNPDTAVKMCVKACPNRTLASREQLKTFFEETGSQLCEYSVSPENYDKATISDIGECPTLPVSASTSIMFRCFPESYEEVVNSLYKYFNSQPVVSYILTDIYMSRYAILGLCFLAVLVSFIIVLLLRYVASVVVYVIAIFLTLASLAATGLLWYNYAVAKGATAKIEALELEKLRSEEISAQTFFWYAIVASVITVILLLLILVMRKRVAITVELFYEAGKCMVHMPCLLTQPLWTFIILILFWMCWLIISLHNAYSLVAINGTHFCKSACDALSTLLSNALRVIAINTVGMFVLFLGKCMVVAITAGVAAVVVMQVHPNLHYVAAPIGAVALFSYLIAHCFLSVYEMAVDTLLLCFCEDCRVNDGSPGKEYFMSKSLMAYVRKSSKHLDTLDGRKKKTEETENLRGESVM